MTPAFLVGCHFLGLTIRIAGVTYIIQWELVAKSFSQHADLSTAQAPRVESAATCGRTTRRRQQHAN